MCYACSCLSLVVYLRKRPAGDKADTVRFVSIFWHNQIIARLLNVHNKVSCECDGGGKDTFALLSFTFTVKLFPPLRKVNEIWFKADEYLSCISFSVKCITCSCIFDCDV